MMKSRLSVIGLGPGNLDYLTGRGIKLISNCEIIVGGERQLKEIEPLLTNQKTYILKKLNEMVEFVKQNLDSDIAFIVSGDTGYYSLLTYLKNNFKNSRFEVVPGISSYQYLFAKLQMTWERYTLCSVHGRDNEYIKLFKNSDMGVVLLTDEKNNPIEIARNLEKQNITDVEVIIGERLSYSDESIIRFNLKNYKNYIREYKMNVTILRKV